MDSPNLIRFSSIYCTNYSQYGSIPRHKAHVDSFGLRDHVTYTDLMRLMRLMRWCAHYLVWTDKYRLGLGFSQHFCRSHDLLSNDSWNFLEGSIDHMIGLLIYSHLAYLFCFIVLGVHIALIRVLLTVYINPSSDGPSPSSWPLVFWG